MEIITREEALEKGLQHYFTGKPCPHGHMSEKWVSNYGCVACKDNRSKSGRPDGKTYKPNSEHVNVLPLPAGEELDGLADLSRIGLTTTGLVPGKTLTVKEWDSCCIAMSKVKSGIQWVIGDLWNASERGTKADFMEEQGISPKSAEQYGWVCRVFPYDRRWASLSFSHHRAIASSELFPTPEDKENVLYHIESKGFSIRQTEAWIRKSKPTTTRVAVDPAVKDCRVVMKALKDAEVVPGEVAKKLREARKLLENNQRVEMR